MPSSVRDKYRETVREFRRAESLPERLSLWRRLLAWVICQCRNSTCFFVIFLLPFYLIGIGIWKFHECGKSENDTQNISMWLVIAGVLMLITALYVPLRRRAKVKARLARAEPPPHIRSSTPDPPEELTEEEINKQTRCFMHHISNITLTALCGVLPYMAVYTFRKKFGPECAPIIYWTAFVLSVFYCIVMTIMILICFVSCCGLFVYPLCKGKGGGGRRNEEGGTENA